MAAAVSSSSEQRWLHGPGTDLLLGCGLGYAVVFVLLACFGPEIRSVLPYGLAPLILLVSGTPHYGATLLRVYERRQDRRAYAVFAVWATLLIAALFVAATRNALLGSWMLTVMLTWSPWHYTGQNYGITLMFLRRRGVPISSATKRCLYASFFLSFLLTVLAVHGATPGGEYAPTPYSATAIRFIPLGIPDAVCAWGLAIFGAAYVASLVVSAVLLLRVAPARDLGPSAVLVATQALWFAVPVLVRHYGALQGVEPLATQYAAYAFLWVAVGHSIQYLWVCSYYARRSGSDAGGGRYLVKTLLAGAAIWTVPALLFSPRLIGPMPFDAGLDVLIAAAVNIHHFVLDGAIWKLRDGRVARILIRSTGREAAEGASSDRPRLRLAPAVWALGAVCVAIIALDTVEREFGVRRALKRGDAQRVEQATHRLDWMGRTSPAALASLSVLRAQLGDTDGALASAEESLALYPTPEGYEALGTAHVEAGRAARAIVPYREALRLRPGWPVASNQLAWLRATHPDDRLRDPREAVRLAEEAARATGFSNPRVLDTLAAAYAASHRYPEARRTAAQARALSVALDDEELASEIEARLRLYERGQPYRTPAAEESTGSAAAGARQRTSLDSDSAPSDSASGSGSDSRQRL